MNSKITQTVQAGFDSPHGFLADAQPLDQHERFISSLTVGIADKSP